MATTEITETLRYIDSDGHILEHPTGMPDYAPAQFRDRIWHIETDESGQEWLLYNGQRGPANYLAAAGTAGLSDEERARSFRGELRYTEVRPAAYNAKARLQDMDTDGIDLAVLYPTMLLGLQSLRDVDFGEAQARAYNDWCSDHVLEGEGRLFGAGAVPPMHEPDDVARVAAEIRRVAELPGMVSVFMRPNPSVDWRPFNDPVYDPIWQAAQDTGLPIALHPFLSPDLPGACVGLKLARPRHADGRYADDWDGEAAENNVAVRNDTLPSVLFTQAIANPVDVMSCIAYLTAGGVCERFPDAKFIFLEANGGWIVPWLERLDHHCKKFQWEVQDLSMLPSDYMKRQCWISFDPDEAMLAFTAKSPLVGADRIIWASDYPHPDAKFPGVTVELAEALEGLTFDEQQAITSRERARALRDWIGAVTQMGKMLVFTNAVEGRDDEFNEWYDNVHLAEVVSLPGFVAATRHELADAQMFPEQSHRYLAIYEYKGDAADALAALGAGAATMNMSDALAGDAKLVLFEDR